LFLVVSIHLVWNFLIYFILNLFLASSDKCHYVARAGLILVILLPQPPKCFGYRCVQPHLALHDPFQQKFTKLFSNSLF
jgi:hypothetical protein